MLTFLYFFYARLHPKFRLFYPLKNGPIGSTYIQDICQEWPTAHLMIFPSLLFVHYLNYGTNAIVFY